MKECMRTLEKLSGALSYENIFSILCGYGDKHASEYLDEDGRPQAVSYAQYARRVRAAAGSFSVRLAGRQGSFVGLKMKNSPNWPTVFWGLLMAGFKPLLLDARGEKAVSAYLLAQAGACAIVTEDGQKYEGVTTIRAEALLSEDEREHFTPAWADEIAVCTSGTTGTARVYVYNGFAMGNQIGNARYFLKNDSDIMYDDKNGVIKNLAFLPMHHIFGLVAVYLWFSFFGKTIVYLRDQVPEHIMHTCRTLGVTHIFCVPLFWNSVAQGIQRAVRQGGPKQEKRFAFARRLGLRLQRLCKRRGGHILGATLLRSVKSKLVGNDIRFLINGGGHIPQETLRLINEVGYPLYNGFGMTEAGITSVELAHDIDRRMSGSVGLPFHSIEYTVRPLREDASIGELLIRGDSLHSARMENGVCLPRESEDGGWFATGDLARLEDGRLFIEGRVKEVIIGASGENVYPDEVEDAFSALPGVSQLTVAGLETGAPYAEETLILQLAPEAELAALAKEIAARNQALPVYKQVRRVLVSGRELPLANGIKVQRQKVARQIEAQSWPVRELDLATGCLLGDEAPAQEKTTAAPPDKTLLRCCQEVRRAFADVLVKDEAEVKDDDDFLADLGGDSLSIVSLTAQLEETYGVTFTEGELQSAPITVRRMAELISAKRKAAAGPRKAAGRVRLLADTEEYRACTLPPHDTGLALEADRALAGTLGGEAALVLADPAAARHMLLERFLGEDDLLVIEEPLAQGTELLRAGRGVFPHGDEVALTALLQDADHRYTKVVVAAQIGEGGVNEQTLLRLKERYRTFLLLTAGPERSFMPGADVQFGTLSGELGGGYAAGSAAWMDYIGAALPGRTLPGEMVLRSLCEGAR